MNHLFSLSGRANRQPYIWHILLDDIVAISLLILIFGGAVMGLAVGIESFGILALLAAWGVVVATACAALCVTVRRLHDLDRTGWQLLLGLIPFVNLYIWFLLFFQPGTQGPNRYGPDPMARRSPG
jgi:uncharacterized membrane protein YhaH (DUF805 family)